MSSYATTSDLAAYGLPSAVLSTIDPATQQEALDAASAKADGYIRSRFVLPLKTWGLDLRQAVAKLAAYDLMSVNGFNPEAGADENLRMRAQDAEKWLANVGKGEISPAFTDSSPTVGADGLSKPSGPRLTSQASRGW